MTPPRRGAYSRQGADEPDEALLRSAMELGRAVPADPGLSDLLDPQPVGYGIDWAALDLDGPPEWASEVDPLLGSMRDVEPRERAWRQQARREQLPPLGDEWLYWVIMAGRGFGKTWSGANTLSEWAADDRGDYGVVAPTFGDARKICTEGESGLVAALGGELREYNKSDYILYLHNGSRIILASADAPDRLRGYNLRGVWVDELASFGAGQQDLWDNVIVPALRIGRRPQAVITSTPRRTAAVLRELLDRAKRGDPAVTITRGSTFDNAANLSPAFLAEIRKRYEGTTTGRQELYGELLAEVEGALVSMARIEALRVRAGQHVPQLRRVVVGVDPSVTDKVTSDACGIIVVGIGGPPRSGWGGPAAAVEGQHLYYLADATTRGSPRAWASRALEVGEEWAADAMVVETNNGGDLCTTMLRMVAAEREFRLPRIMPVTASVNKRLRAEPLAGVWEQGRAHSVGALPGFEDGLSSWVPGDAESPNELDAGVWAAVGVMPELAVKGPRPVRIIA